MWCVRALGVRSRFGSHNTMSASAPTASPPFRGYSPKSRAGLVAVNSTKRLREMRPATTPASCSTSRRSSMAGTPLGIFVKSSRPRTFSVAELYGARSRLAGARRRGDRPAGRLAFQFCRPSQRVELGPQVPGGHVLARQDLDDVAVLAVHHREEAVARGFPQHGEERGVVDLQPALVGPPAPDRGDAPPPPP